MKVGDTVITPGGVGKLHTLEDNDATVEMDFMYLVGYPASEVKPYPLQKGEIQDGKDTR